MKKQAEKKWNPEPSDIKKIPKHPGKVFFETQGMQI